MYIYFNFRQTLGKELTFVHLIMSSEEKRKRLEKRHSEGTNPNQLIDIMEVNKLNSKQGNEDLFLDITHLLSIIYLLEY